MSLQGKVSNAIQRFLVDIVQFNVACFFTSLTSSELTVHKIALLATTDAMLANLFDRRLGKLLVMIVVKAFEKFHPQCIIEHYSFTVSILQNSEFSTLLAHFANFCPGIRS